MIQILKYKDKYYIRSTDNNILINGVKPTQTNWNGWFTSEVEVKSISRMEKVYGKLSHYELMEEHSELAPPWLKRVELGEFDDEDPKSGFYRSVYTRDSEKEVKLEFDVQEVCVQPEEVPYWVQIRWPESMTEIREIAHIYPCSCSGASLYSLIWDAIHDKIMRNLNFKIQNYTSNLCNDKAKKDSGSMVVFRRIIIPESLQKTEVETYYKTLNAKKKSERKFVRQERWNIIFQISNGKDKSNFLLPEIKADNYTQLKVLVDEKVKYYADQIDDTVWSECECCKGIGLTRKEIT